MSPEAAKDETKPNLVEDAWGCKSENGSEFSLVT